MNAQTVEAAFTIEPAGDGFGRATRYTVSIKEGDLSSKAQRNQ